ncbi:hypothetical protein MASR2M17_23430 [Aminivibrio sp.]
MLVDVNEAFVSCPGSRARSFGPQHPGSGHVREPENRALMIERLLSVGHASSIEMECRRKDGMLLLCNISCQFISIGQKRFLLSVVRDMTEFAGHAGDDDPDREDGLRGRHARRVAHEINNPLGIIVQTAQNMALRVRPDFPRNVEKAGELGVDMQAVWAYSEARGLPGMVRDIQSAAVRAANIIRHMLDFSRRNRVQAGALRHGCRRGQGPGTGRQRLRSQENIRFPADSGGQDMSRKASRRWSARRWRSNRSC